MNAHISIKNVGLKFTLYKDKTLSLKETVIKKLLFQKAQSTSEFWALKNINLEISNGDRVGIIGDNGAGKSSLLKTITKIYEPTLGEINTVGSIAPLIELGAGFNPELTGEENIYLNGAILGFSKKEMKKKFDRIVEFAEIGDFINTPVKYYSTGMYMRLAFSIATEIDPEILIIDELFAGGDIHFVEKAKKRMYSLVDNSKIVIIVSHSLDLIKSISNRVILMDHGQVILEGSPDEVIDFYKNTN